MSQPVAETRYGWTDRGPYTASSGAVSDDSGLSVEPIEDCTGSSSPAPGPVAVARSRASIATIRQLTIEARVAALEAQLARKDRQLEEIRTRYESVLANRDRDADEGAGLVASWLPFD